MKSSLYSSLVPRTKSISPGRRLVSFGKLGLTRSLAFFFTAVLLGLTACAPRAVPVTGEIGEAVQASLESGTSDFDHAAWNRLLEEGTSDGLVNYGYFRANEANLNGYLLALAGANLPRLSPDELKALLINAYNAYTLKSVLDHPDVESIKDISGVWDTRTHKVGGHDLTLDEIEHNILRPIFKDPRVHMAVNCASFSCPPLPPWAFEGDVLEEQLEEWTRAFFNSPKYVQIDGTTVHLSRILDWYGADFLEEDAKPRADSLLEFAARYNSDIASQVDSLQVSFMDYDWRVNKIGQ